MGHDDDKPFGLNLKSSGKGVDIMLPHPCDIASQPPIKGLTVYFDVAGKPGEFHFILKDELYQLCPVQFYEPERSIMHN